jgi:prepilin-type N-terminal cleavage/methylation domain-containing protein
VKRRAGFTIIEVLVALAILVFGMTAIIGMLTFGAALTRTALLRTSAAAASQAVVADLEETLFPPAPAGAASSDSEGETGAPLEVKDRPLPSMPDVVYSARAEENPSRPLEYRVDIEMSWKAAGVRRATSFSTILVREISFGERLRRRLVGAEAKDKEEPKDKEAPATPPATSPR